MKELKRIKTFTQTCTKLKCDICGKEADDPKQGLWASNNPLYPTKLEGLSITYFYTVDLCPSCSRSLINLISREPQALSKLFQRKEN